MAHELENWDARRALYGNGRKPWHGLGETRDGYFTLAEVCTAVGGDVIKEPCMRNGVQVPGWHWTVNPQNNEAYSAVQEGYTVIQHSDMAATMAAIVKAAGGEDKAIFENAFTMRNGGRATVTLALAQSLTVMDDILLPYIVGYNTHDTSGACRLFGCAFRPDCANMTRMALAGAKNEVRIRHTESAAAAMALAKTALAGTQTYLGKLSEMFNHLAGKQVTATAAKTYLDELLAIETATTAQGKVIETGTAQAKTKRDKILALYDGAQQGADKVAVRGTAYGLLQAVIEHADYGTTNKVHAKRVEALGGDAVRAGLEMRAESLLDGTIAAFKQSAMDSLLAFVGPVAAKGSAVAVA